MVELISLCADLEVERDALLAVLDPLPDQGWHEPTPAPGWTVRDQVAHLAAIDGLMRVAIADPRAFDEMRAQHALDRTGFLAEMTSRAAELDGRGMCAWWRDESGLFLEAIAASDPAVRVPWFGPAMSVASAVTARIMETWAHGQDVVDALAIPGGRPVTPRIRHVCEIGVRAFANGYRVRGLDVPDVALRVVLTGPGGETWTWGPETASPAAGAGPANVGPAVESITGPALDFALVVTRRRRADDTALVAVGVEARRWLTLAQAFAGPPGADPARHERSTDRAP